MLTEAEELELLELEEAEAMQGAEEAAPEPQGSALFPATQKTLQTRTDKISPAIGLDVVGDILNAPSRALATTRGQEMTDPDAYVFKPEVEKYKEGIESVPLDAPFTKGIAKFGTELVGRTISDPLMLVGPLKWAAGAGARFFGGNAASKLNKASGSLAQELSGVPEETLRMGGTKEGRAALQQASGKEAQIGQKLADAISDYHSYMPEREVIDRALQDMPPVNISGTIKALQGAKVKPASNGALLPHERKANQEIDALIQGLLGDRRPGGMPTTKLSAQEAYDLRRRLDYQANFDTPEYKLVNGALIKARTQLKNDLLSAAGRSGNKEYATTMKAWADKLKILGDLEKRLGTTDATRQARSESFVNNLFGKNSANKQKIVEDLDKVFSTDFLGEAKMAQRASEIGEGGKAAILPRQSTGRSQIAAGTGAVLGPIAASIFGGPGAAAATGAVGLGLAAHASPYVASRATLPATKWLDDALNGRRALSAKGKALANAYKKTTSAATKARIVDQLKREIEKEE